MRQWNSGNLLYAPLWNRVHARSFGLEPFASRSIFRALRCASCWAAAKPRRSFSTDTIVGPFERRLNRNCFVETEVGDRVTVVTCSPIPPEGKLLFNPVQPWSRGSRDGATAMVLWGCNGFFFFFFPERPKSRSRVFFAFFPSSKRLHRDSH